MITANASSRLARGPSTNPWSRIEVDPPGETFSLDGGNGGGDNETYVETQAQNLKSDKLAVAVIRQLPSGSRSDLVPDSPGAGPEPGDG